MKTILEFKDGHSQSVDNVAPSISMEEKTVICMDVDSTCVDHEIPLALLSRIVFETD